MDKENGESVCVGRRGGTLRMKFVERVHACENLSMRVCGCRCVWSES